MSVLGILYVYKIFKNDDLESVSVFGNAFNLDQKKMKDHAEK